MGGKHLQKTHYLVFSKKDLNKILSELNTQIIKLSDQIQSFRSLAEERSTEIKRYKEGYDFAKSKSLAK